MPSLFALAALLPALAAAVPCVQFDSNGGLYAFGGAEDVSLGTSSSWSSPSPTPLSSTGRPPWTGTNTQCFLSEFNNALYVLNGDEDPSSLYIYDFANDAWSKQATAGAPDAVGSTRSSAVLDRDTNVIFTIGAEGQMMYQLDLELIKATAAGTAQWTAVRNPSFSTTGYKVTGALANNHIVYFGVPETPAGSANMFVIHYSYFQPAAQTFTAVSGATLPNAPGQAASLPANDSSPYQILFVPDDFSNSFIVTHYTDLANYSVTEGAPMSVGLINSTQTLPAPTSKDAESSYACSETACVQVDTKGDIYYINNPVSADFTVSSGAQWTKMGYSVVGKPPASETTNSTDGAAASGSASGGSSSGSASKSGSADPSSSSAAGTSNPSNSAAAPVIRSDLVSLGLGVLALALATAL